MCVLQPHPLGFSSPSFHTSGLANVVNLDAFGGGSVQIPACLTRALALAIFSSCVLSSLWRAWIREYYERGKSEVSSQPVSGTTS